MPETTARAGSRWPTPSTIRALIDTEIEAARHGDDPWPALERAHLLSQPWAWPHTRVHGSMLAVAIRDRDRSVAFGQVVRLIVAGPGSLTGRFPAGNTGRATMGLTATADTPHDIADILSRYEDPDEPAHTDDNPSASPDAPHEPRARGRPRRGVAQRVQ